MIDIQEDKRQAQQWDNDLTDGEMSITEIAHLAATGLSTCQSFCGSRKYVGENSCECIRARFPSPAHYELYLLARNYFQKLVSLGLLAAAVSLETHGEKLENNTIN